MRETDYNITVGGEPCPVFRITENSVDCTPPQTGPGGRTSVPVIVSTSVCVGGGGCNILCKNLFNYYPDIIYSTIKF